MTGLKSGIAREPAARPGTGAATPQGGLFTEHRAVGGKAAMLDRISRSQAEVGVIGATGRGLFMGRLRGLAHESRVLRL